MEGEDRLECKGRYLNWNPQQTLQADHFGKLTTTVFHGGGGGIEFQVV